MKPIRLPLRQTVAALVAVFALLLSACGENSPAHTSGHNTTPSAGSQPVLPRCSSADMHPSQRQVVTSWSTSPTDALITPPMFQNTMRQFIAPHWAGEVMQLRLTNRYSDQAMTIENLYIAEESAEGPPALAADSECALTFAGETKVTMQPGDTIVSDPIAFPVRPFKRLGISFYAPEPVLQITRHLGAQETPYMTLNGDQTSDPSGALFIPMPISLSNNFLAIEALEVSAARKVGTVVAVGDSITDGSGQALEIFGLYNTGEKVGLDQRYPDFLAKRLLEAQLPFTVANAGIGGNELLRDAVPPQFGRSLLNRFDEDVLSIAGVTDIIVMIGTNDFGSATTVLGIVPSAKEVIDGYIELIERAHAHGANILLATIPPARGTITGTLPLGLSDRIGVMHGSDAAKAARDEVNAWIRSQSLSDGIVDFEQCLQDPANPDYLLPEYNSGDNLHPSAAGYEAMANCVDLSLLVGPQPD